MKKTKNKNQFNRKSSVTPTESWKPVVFVWIKSNEKLCILATYLTDNNNLFVIVVNKMNA